MATANKTTAPKASDKAQAADVTKASAPAEPTAEYTNSADATKTTENADQAETEVEDSQAATTLATPATEMQSTADTKPEEKAEVAAPAAKAEKVKALEIVSKADGFRRAGRAWSQAGETVPRFEFTDEQIAQLKAEPMLTVTEVELDTE